LSHANWYHLAKAGEVSVALDDGEDQPFPLLGDENFPKGIDLRNSRGHTQEAYGLMLECPVDLCGRIDRVTWSLVWNRSRAS
jgi:hypothetical protein